MAGAQAHSVSPRTVLLVCTGNTCRSPMAAALLQRLRPGWKLEQGGVEPGLSNGLASRVLVEMGLEAAPQRGKDWKLQPFIQPDAVLVFSEKALEVLQQSKPDWPLIAMLVYDPAEVGGKEEQRLQAYRECALEIERSLQRWLISCGW
jgi:protein-tyrosine-phosphatase